MKLERYVKVIAGAFVFVSALLGYLHHEYWLFFTMFVGLNLFQYGFSQWCLMANILKKLGVKE